MSPGPHLEEFTLLRRASWVYAQHQKQLGRQADLPGPFTCRCGAEDHVEAVKKLQNSTKLLQKVIDYSMEGGEGWALPGTVSWNRLGPCT